MKKTIISATLLLCLLLTTGCGNKSPQYKDGSYSASAQGYGGDVSVTVTVKNGKIVTVDIGPHSETPEVATTALDTVPKNIVMANSTSVDGVAGATVTSNAIKNAATEALKQATP